MEDKMLTAEEVNRLKEKTKAEMARRSGIGSLKHFADINYDFSKIPASSDFSNGEYVHFISAEHGKKIIDMLLNIQDYGDLKSVEEGDLIPESFNTGLLEYIDKLSREPMTGSSTSCRSSCSGLCILSCMITCSGCSGQCMGCRGCDNACDISCSGCSGCSIGCSSGCNGCSSSCGSGCSYGSRAS